MKVLIVGGDDAERSAIEHSLGAGAEPAVALIWASTLDEGLAKLKNGNSPDVLLLDDRLARKQPGKIFGQINAAARLPIIVFADEDQTPQSLELIRLGASDLIARRELDSPRLAQTILRSAERAFREVNLLAQISNFALEKMTEGVLTLDQQHFILMWSPGMERMFGVPAKDAIGKQFASVLPFLRADQASLLEALAGKESTGRMNNFYVQQRREYGHFQFNYSPLRNGNEIIGVICLAREKAAAPDAQSDQYLPERMRMVSDEVPSLIWLSDTAGDRIMFNSRWLDFTGRQPNDEKGSGWLENVHPHDAQRFWQIYKQAVTTRQPYHGEYRMKRADGQYRVMLESGKPQFSKDKTFIGMIGSCNDISETRLTQHRLPPAEPGEEQETFSSTLHHAPIAVWKLDRDLVITKANPEVAKQLRMLADELVGKSFTSIVSLPANIIDAVLARGERVRLENFPINLTNGNEQTKVFWDIAAWPWKDNDDQIVGIILSTQEVSERQRRVQQREDFVATLVHDLKTPLIGADRTLEQIIGGGMGSLDSGQAEVLSMLRRSNHQLLTMVQNLIEVYRYESGPPKFVFEELDLFQLARGCIRELQALALHRSVTLEDELPAGQCLVGCDRLAMRRVFLNLLDNALKFTPPTGSIRVTGKEEGDSVEIEVEDTGIGISEAEQSKLFQRFWQGETGKRYAPGTGLGLYLCRQIIIGHRGTITVKSAENAGTTFSIIMPRRQPVSSSR